MTESHLEHLDHPDRDQHSDPTVRACLAILSAAERTLEVSYQLLLKVESMSQVLRDGAAAAAAEMNRAALINADLTTKNAALTTQVTDLTAQVATLSANQEDAGAEQTAADALAAATAGLKAADDTAQPPEQTSQSQGDGSGEPAQDPNA